MSNELVKLDQMPVMDLATAKNRRDNFVAFVKTIMTDGIDFGTVPGTNKPTLLKPGAEKLSTFFGLIPQFEILDKVEDWDRPLFHYQYKCTLSRDGRVMGEGIGSCNSYETKYRWRWVSENDLPIDIDPNTCTTRTGSIWEFEFAINRGETSGKYGKPKEYWDNFKAAIKAGEAKQISKSTKNGQSNAWEIASTVYRVPNDEVYSQINTIDKMAQKRALVAAVLIGANASEFFTQDLDDMDIIDITPGVVAELEIVPQVEQKPTKQSTTQEPSNSEKNKPYHFPSTASQEFWAKVQEATGEYYESPFQLTTVITGKAGQWFNFADQNLYDEKLDLAVSHAKEQKAD